MNENLHILKILSDIAETTFRTRRSSISRIEASDFTPEGKENLKSDLLYNRSYEEVKKMYSVK